MTTAELLLPPGVANTYSFHPVILQDLFLQFGQGTWFPDDNAPVAFEVACA